MRLLLKTLAAVLVLAVLVTVGLRLMEAKPLSAGRTAGALVVPVEVALARVGLMRDTAYFTGTLEAPQRFTVSPKIAGRLVALRKDVGDPVSRGELVAVLDDDEYRQAVGQKEAELKVQEANVALAEAEYAAAQRDFDREKVLHAQRVTPFATFDRVEVAMKTKEAQLRMAESLFMKAQAELDLERTRHSYTRVHAEWEGDDSLRYVGERTANVGDTLRAHDVICSIVNLEVLTAVINVTERDYAKLKLGAPVLLTTDAFPGSHFLGKVKRVPPELREASREARVEVEVPNDEQLLKPGMFVRAIIEFGRRENASIVPVTALTRYNSVEGVFLAEPRVEAGGEPGWAARFVPIRRGFEEMAVRGREGDVGRVEVIEPKDFHGRVVTVGQHLLSDGVAVTFDTVKEMPSALEVEPAPAEAPGPEEGPERPPASA